MQPLWAPWRGDYIEQQKPTGCVFCALPAEEGEEADRRNLILGRTPRAFAILNRYPYNPGHLMVIPRAHVSRLTALEPDVFVELHALLRLSIAAVEEVYRPQGLNVGANLGSVAGAGIAEHLHYHVVPRWGGDTNFMPVLAATKVLIEHLDRTWERLHPVMARELAAASL